MLKQNRRVRFRVLFIAATIMTMVVIGIVVSHTYLVSRARASSLSIPYLSQYQGQSTENFDCGPASVAMVAQFFGHRPDNISDADFISQLRQATGNTTLSDTNFSELENAISSVNLSYSEISNSATPQPDAEIQVMQDALSHGNAVIALIHGADLGRGTNYGDHWVVVRGFSDDGQSVYLNDADNQQAKLPHWIRGGVITIPFTTFKAAAADAQVGSYGIIVSNANTATIPLPNPCGTSAAIFLVFSGLVWYIFRINRFVVR